MVDRNEDTMSHEDYNALPTTIADYDGTTVSEWPGRHDDQRYTVLHPACGVNIKPSGEEKTADRKARKHARTCGKR
jgi:hypothetical protein